MIYATVNMTVGDYESTCDTKIVLYRGDKNVEIRFVIKGNRFTVLDSTYAQMIIVRPSSTSIFSEPAAIQNDTVILTITEDMIDELKEIGEYTFQIRLYDNSMNARATLPPCKGGLIINQPIAVEGEGEALVNVARINDSAVLAAASDVPEEEIFTEDNAYNRTVWMDGDIITDARMNKIEKGIEQACDNSKASNISITDIAGNYESTNVEDALEEVMGNFKNLEISGLTLKQIKCLDAMFQKCSYLADVTEEYDNFKKAFGVDGSSEGGETEKDLISISVQYTGGDVVVGTSLLSLTGITVMASYSDGSTAVVTGYSLEGTITEGNNTITVTYKNATTSFDVIGYSKDSRTLIYNWDLTSGIVDSKSQVSATLNGATQDSTGLVLSAITDFAFFPNVWGINRTIEIDVVSYDRKSTAHGRLAMFKSKSTGMYDSGFIFRSTGFWQIYQKAWSDGTVSDSTILNGKTLKITIDSDSTMTATVGDIFLTTKTNIVLSEDTTLAIGSSNGNSAYDLTISAIRVYEGV